ncbi:hypothetical protein WMY93_010835 [Mugilogobius chulae]|uniref:BRCT domain-containing protein n=1 Tax=Mugilogobius chulae TaxID=88201 RepID=A0AAW0PBR2_9GOBI
MEQRKKGGLLGKLAPGEKKLDGRTFYLDRVKKRSTTLLLEAITLFGGKVESFLHKDVTFVVTGCLEELEQKDSETKPKTEGEATPSKQRESTLKQDRQKQGTPRPALNACGSRGKALLEKAILNNERLQASSALTNARSWGVKILFADDVLFYLKQLSRDSLDTKSKKSEKVYSKQSPNCVKAAPLRSPYLKVEDSSRKYKPLHMQSMSFPSLYYSGRYSPFECPPPPRFDKWTEKKRRKTLKISRLWSALRTNVRLLSAVTLLHGSLARRMWLTVNAAVKLTITRRSIYSQTNTVRLYWRLHIIAW